MISAATSTMRTPANLRARTHDRLRGYELMVLGGHCFVYSGMLLVAFAQNDSFRYITYLGCAATAAGSVALIRPRRGIWTWMVMALCALLVGLALHGLLRDNNSSYLVYDVITFGLFGGALGRPGERLRSALFTMYGYLVAIGVLVAALLLSRLEAGTLDVRFISDSTFNPFAIPALCIPALYLLLLAGSQSRLIRASGWFAASVLVLFGITTLTRGAIVLALLGAFLSWRLSPQRLRARWPLMLALAVAAIVFVNWGRSMFDDSLYLMGQRLGQEDWSAGRVTEGRVFLGTLSPFERMFGLGLGGSNQTSDTVAAVTALNIVHFGHLHLLLKGGYLLLGMVAIVTTAGLYSAWRRRSAVDRAAASCVLLFVTANFLHTQFIAETPMVLFAMCLGLCLHPDPESPRTADAALPPQPTLRLRARW